MVKEDCLYYEKHNDMGATIHWCQNYPHLNFDCDKCERYTEKNFVRVVRCKDCKWNYDTSVNHGNMFPKCKFTDYVRTGDFYCAMGERREDGKAD